MGITRRQWLELSALSLLGCAEGRRVSEPPRAKLHHDAGGGAVRAGLVDAAPDAGRAAAAGTGLDTLALERRFPALAGALPRLRLGMFPTPVERLEALGERVGVRELWLKRDDRAAVELGGSKVRKLELSLAAARAAGARHVLTFGGVGSNHALATAFYGKQVGLKVALFLLAERPSARVQNVLRAMLSYDATVNASHGSAEDVLRFSREHAGEKPWVIAAGGSSAIGDIGYVSAALELVEQIERGELPEPRTLVVAAGTTVQGAVGFGAALIAAPLLVLIEPTLVPGPISFGTIAFVAGGVAWVPILAVIATATLLFGSLGALGQRNIKRMMGYSGIGHAGYLLMGITAMASAEIAGRAADGPPTAILFYLLAYALTGLTAFAVIVLVAGASGGEHGGRAWRGLWKRSPFLAVAMLLALLSLAGVPPMSGFFAKFLVLKALVDQGLTPLAFLGAGAVIVGLYFYFVWMKEMYFKEPDPELDAGPIHVPLSSRLALIAGMIGMVGMGVFMGPFHTWAEQAAAALLATAR